MRDVLLDNYPRDKANRILQEVKVSGLCTHSLTHSTIMHCLLATMLEKENQKHMHVWFVRRVLPTPSSGAQPHKSEGDVTATQVSAHIRCR